MSRAKSQMTSLALRKKLLLAENEVNRERLLHECQQLGGEVRRIRGKFSSTLAAVASAASVGIAGAKAIGEVRSRCSKEKGSWLSALFDGMRAGTSLWRSMRSGRS